LHSLTTYYSELADFFYAWQQLGTVGRNRTTRHEAEVQDTNANEFGRKLRNVFAECARVLKNDGLLIFTYHHSREEGWMALADAILQPASNEDAISKANAKLGRLKKAGLRLSENDRKVVTQGQLMTTLAPLGAKGKETGRAFGRFASDVKVAS